MSLELLMRKIDELYEKYLTVWEDVCRIESSTDCKGGAVAALYAMDALAQCGFTDRPVMLLLQSDEEKGSAPSGYSTIRSICEKAQNAAAFLNCEPSSAGKAILTRRGILRHPRLSPGR